MATYKTPGVYTEEISTLPPSVAQVSTAITAFVGYTYDSTGTSDTPQIERVTTFLEYQELFGGPQHTDFEITVNSNGTLKTTIPEGKELIYLMYYAIDLYFKNGGGPCYIVSLGAYKSTPSILLTDFERGLKALEKEDEPTLIVLPDAVNLSQSDYYTACNIVLDQCHKLGDRFGIFDILPQDTDGSKFRNHIRSEAEYLKYGATYIPYLNTSISRAYDEDKVDVKKFTAQYTIAESTTEAIKVSYIGDVQNSTPQIEVSVLITKKASKASKALKTTTPAAQFTITDNKLLITLPAGGSQVTDIITKWQTWKANNNAAGFDLEESGSGSTNIVTPLTATPLSRDFTDVFYNEGNKGLEIAYKGPVTTNIPEVTIVANGSASDDIGFETVAGKGQIPASLKITLKATNNKTASDIVTEWTTFAATPENAKGFVLTKSGDGSNTIDDELPTVSLPETTPSVTLTQVKQNSSSFYNSMVTELSAQKVTLPPSSAMAGVYVTTDNNRGVWKAPANVSVVSVTGPTEDINAQEQENLNIDSTAGKSINAIRSFTGKGTLVWGARTLAGNDNEWRYISVRRLFSTIEESCRKSTGFAVFEPNNAVTWLKVKAMIDGYLYGLWQQGALAGTSSEEAFFVNVGMGKTMTSQDILEGRMIVEIGIAAVRPAEFIILRFSHKLQES
ncbi:MAG: hypothetical protein GKR88_10865 [Flavobacteriaceae bacterium]|nr:MAG: hypothetical protein GKR88_10865 [Flavobacteriaceae bacterium]